MSERPRVVLVTGAATFLGGYLATRLKQDPSIERVLAVDSRSPSKDMLRRMGRAEFIRADIRRPSIAKVISSTGVDTVVHAATSVLDTVGHSPAIKEFNVIGGMQVLAACQRSESVKRLVLRSSAMVYGVGPGDPSHFAEGVRPHHEPKRGFGRDLIDVEGYARGLARRRPDVAVTILRLAPILGPRIDTRMSMYFRSTVTPTVLGHDPRLQLLHEEDALAAMVHATMLGRSGTFNVGADGVVMLSQAVRRVGRVSVPLPRSLVSPFTTVSRGRPTSLLAEQVGLLTYGRVMDNTRMRTELGFEPKYSTVETVDDYVAGRGIAPVVPREAWTRVEAWLADRAAGSDVAGVTRGAMS